MSYGGKSTSYKVTVQDLFEGKGTADDPYKINSAVDLSVLANMVNNTKAYGLYGYAYYLQTQDIDLSDFSNWTPIGSCYADKTTTTVLYDLSFFGHYNGGYHKVTGLKMSNTRSYTGLFGRMRGTLRNLSVTGDVKGVDYVGGVAGEVSWNAKIECCDFTGTVTGKNNVGGVVGYNYGGGTINSCYANAKVSASAGAAGGVVGGIMVGVREDSGNCYVKDCYFVGTLTGKQAGGVAGITHYDTVSDHTITFTNNYYLQTAAEGGVNGATAAGCTNLHQQTIQQNPAMLGKNYVMAAADQNDGYPVFYWQMVIPFKGAGTEKDPYQIATKDHIVKMSELVNNTLLNAVFGEAYYIQTADIDMKKLKLTPIGCFYPDKTSDEISHNATFRGQYDGNQHKITNLYVNNTRSYSGLFGRLTKGTVKNLSVSGAVSGTTCTGGIVGELGYGGLIQNCDFTGSVSGTDLVGGILGKVHAGGDLASCYANAKVSASADGGRAGGIVGCIHVANHVNSVNTEVKNCYAVGTITGEINGGICGVALTGTSNASTFAFTNNYYLTTAADGAVNNKKAEGVTMYGSKMLKTIAPELGTPFVTNPNAMLNNGYPVFKWQLTGTGDVNLDGKVSMIDVVALQQYLLTLQPFTEEKYKNADLTTDGKVNAFDLAMLKRMVAGS